MSPAHVAALVVVGSGLLHATWNALAKAAEDRYAAVASMGIGQTISGLLVLPFTGLPRHEAWLWALASIAVHVVYFATLTKSYEVGDFSQVYPLARGVGPLVVAIVAVFAFAERLSLPQTVGLLAISGGLVVLAFAGRRGPVAWPPIVAALATGATIAAYTLIDGAGARTGGDPIGYAALMFTGLGPASLLWAWAVRRRALYPAMAKQLCSGVGGGVTSVLAYGIVIWAQTIAPIALVAALRETGVIAGAVIGVVAFRERMPAARIAAATVVVLGIVLLNAAS